MGRRKKQRRRLTLEDAERIRLGYAEGKSQILLAREWNVSQPLVSQIVNNQKWVVPVEPELTVTDAKPLENCSICGAAIHTDVDRWGEVIVWCENGHQLYP